MDWDKITKEIADHLHKEFRGQPPGGPEDAFDIAEAIVNNILKGMLAKENQWEKVCKEWLKGCSCASPGNQEECEECTKAFHARLRKLIARES